MIIHEAHSKPKQADCEWMNSRRMYDAIQQWDSWFTVVRLRMVFACLLVDSFCTRNSPEQQSKSWIPMVHQLRLSWPNFWDRSTQDEVPVLADLDMYARLVHTPMLWDVAFPMTLAGLWMCLS